jgi:hypothetical protein
MRTTRESTDQTTCDGGDGFCPGFVITAGFDPLPAEARIARHRQIVEREGWADCEGRDYCPDHIPAGARTAP